LKINIVPVVPATAASNSNSTGLSSSLTLLLAAGGGFTAATLCYSQPMLGVMAGDIEASVQAIGMVPMSTQLGYAVGLLLLAPLGDRYDRRTIILVKAMLLAAALLLAGAAPGIGILLAASLAVGLAATLAQEIVPAVAILAVESQRGKAVGQVMTGVLLGILLSRVVSGFVAEYFGWRAMFYAAAASIALMGVAMWRGLPRFQPTTQLSYGALLGSLTGLFRRHRSLRRAALFGQGNLGQPVARVELSAQDHVAQGNQHAVLQRLDKHMSYV
jgi:predicted MFS family arabinose efflux permease